MSCCRSTTRISASASPWWACCCRSTAGSGCWPTPAWRRSASASGRMRLMVMAAIGSVVSTTLYGLVENEAVQIAARMLWGISYAALNLSTLAYAVSDRANAGKRVGASRAAIGLVQAMSLVGGAWIALQVGPRSVFLIFGGLTLISLVAALLLPPPAARDRRQEALPVAGPASPGDLGLHAGLHRRRRVPAHALLPDEGFDHLGRAGAGDGDPSGAALAGRDHHRSAGRLDRRPLRRAAHLDRQRRAAGRGLRADRTRSRAAGRAGRGHDAWHVQHPDPGAGARARQVERAELAGELFDLARLRRRARATVGALAVPQHPAGAALCGRSPQRSASARISVWCGVSSLPGARHSVARSQQITGTHPCDGAPRRTPRPGRRRACRRRAARPARRRAGTGWSPSPRRAARAPWPRPWRAPRRSPPSA